MWLLAPVEPEKLARRGLQLSYVGKRVKGCKCASKHMREGILNRETACVKYGGQPGQTAMEDSVGYCSLCWFWGTDKK